MIFLLSLACCPFSLPCFHVFLIRMSVVLPQKTWSPIQLPWKLAIRRWVATSPSSPTRTTLPTKNCRHDTQRTWMKPWAQCRSFIIDWPPALWTTSRLLPWIKTNTKPCSCSTVAVSNTPPITAHPFSIHDPLCCRVVFQKRKQPVYSIFRNLQEEVNHRCGSCGKIYLSLNFQVWKKREGEKETCSEDYHSCSCDRHRQLLLCVCC